MLIGIKYIFQVCISKSLINVNDLGGGEYVKTNALRLDAEFLMKKGFKGSTLLLKQFFFLVVCTHVKHSSYSQIGSVD